MKRVCSFCNTVIQEGETPQDPVSHGICKTCYNRFLSIYRFNLRKFLDMLEAPVFFVDENANVLEANSQARKLIGKPIEKFAGNVCGIAFECRNALLPEGCGKTIHCPDCAIRKSVEETWATGKAVRRRLAVIPRGSGDQMHEDRFLVTTEKDGDIVLLRLEPEHAGLPAAPVGFAEAGIREKR